MLCILSSYAMTSSQMFQGKSAWRPRVTPSRCEGTPDDASDSGGGSGRNSSLAASVVQCCLCRSRVDRFKKSQDILRCFDWETPRGRNDVLELKLWPQYTCHAQVLQISSNPRVGWAWHVYLLPDYFYIFFYIVIIVIWHLHLYWLSEMVKSVASRPLHILTCAEESPGWDVSSSSA